MKVNEKFENVKSKWIMLREFQPVLLFSYLDLTFFLITYSFQISDIQVDKELTKCGATKSKGPSLGGGKGQN